ncbi:MAG: ComEC/Rec2 family competence protein, partial [Nitrospinota bacterium]
MMPRLFQKYFFCVEVSKIPWLYFFLCFYVCGIVFARTRVSFFPLFLVAGVSFLFLTCHFPKKTKLLISVGSVLLFALGYSFTLAKSISGVTPPERLKISSGKVDIRGILFKFPERVRFGERLIIQTEEMRSEGRGTPVQVLVRVTCYNFLSGLQQGDSVQIENIRLKRPTNFNNPGGLNYRQYLLDRGIELTGSIRRESQITLLRRESSFSVGAFLYGLKTTMVRFIEENSGPEVGSFLKAASFGERGAVSPDMRDLFSKAGTSHILAVSGLHVGFVTFLFFAIFKKVFSFVFLRFHIRSFMLGHTGRYAAFLTIPFLSAYVLMVGNSPSSFRAAV